MTAQRVSLLDVVSERRAELRERIELLTRELDDVTIIFPVLHLIGQLQSFEHVSQVTLTSNYTTHHPVINMFLAKEHQASSFVRDVARMLHIKLEKQSLSYSEGLLVTGNLEGIDLAIYGYLPPSCRIEYEEVEQPARMIRRAKVVCGDDAA